MSAVDKERGQYRDPCQDAVFAFLSDPATHHGLAVRRIDTHAAVVFLVGERALKVKRAVRFPFLDFSTLAKRKAVCDAEIEQDLSAIADASMALGRSTIWAGSAGLAYHLPQAAGFAHGVGYPPVSSLDQPLASGPTLFVVGSLSSVSREQVKVLAASSDVITFNIPPNTLLAGETSPDWREHELALKQALYAGIDVAVGSGAEFRDSTMGQLLSAALALMVKPYADRIGGLVATGGESARAVLEAWGIHRLRLVSELEAGLACSVTEGWSGLLPVLTKAGAFGTPQTLLNCWEFLHRLDRSSTVNLCQSKGL